MACNEAVANDLGVPVELATRIPADVSCKERKMMAGTRVSLTRSDDSGRSVSRAVGLIGGMSDLDRPGAQVIIKPGIFDPTHQPYTDVRVARAAAALFYLTKDISFAESDNPVRTGMEALKGAGYQHIVEAGLLDLSNNLSRVRRRRLKLLKQQKFSRMLLEADVLVNLATVKADLNARKISIGVKNLFGLIPDRTKFHFHNILDEVLFELLMIFRPSLTIVDATTVYLGSYPDYEPVDLGLIIAGRDVVAVDAICCRIMGINPVEVRHLLLASRAGKGTIDIDEIEVLGLRLGEAQGFFDTALRSPR